MPKNTESNASLIHAARRYFNVFELSRERSVHCLRFAIITHALQSGRDAALIAARYPVALLIGEGRYLFKRVNYIL